MTNKQNENNKIIKVDFQKKNNKESKHVAMLLPEAAFPFNLNADTMLILGDMSLAKKIWKGYYEVRPKSETLLGLLLCLNLIKNKK